MPKTGRITQAHDQQQGRSLSLLVPIDLCPLILRKWHLGFPLANGPKHDGRLGYFQHELSGVLTFEKLEQGFRESFQAVHDVLA